MDHARILWPLPSLSAAVFVGLGPGLRLHGGLPTPGRLHPQLQKGEPDEGEQHERGGGGVGGPLLPAHSSPAAAGPGQDLMALLPPPDTVTCEGRTLTS